MYCEKCGADNSETATYCRKCGVFIAEAEEETRVAARPGRGDAELPGRWEAENHPGFQPPLARHEGGQGDEAEIFSISPTLLFVKAGYAAAAVGALFLVAIV